MEARYSFLGFLRVWGPSYPSDGLLKAFGEKLRRKRVVRVGTFVTISGLLRCHFSGHADR